MQTPEPPIVPPAPSRAAPKPVYAAQADALAAFYQPLVAYIIAVIAWIADAMQQVAASLASGNLPSLTGHAGKIVVVNDEGTLLNLRAPTSLMLDTALEGMETARGRDVILGAGGNAPWNWFHGAAEPDDTAVFPTSVTSNGVTASQIARGIDPVTRAGFWEYRVQGTATAASLINIHITPPDRRAPAAPQQTWTVSLFAQIVAGTPPTNSQTGLRLDIMGTTPASQDAEFISGPVVSPTTSTLISRSGALVNPDVIAARPRVILRTEASQTVDYTIRFEAPQFERGPARTNGQYRELTRREAAQIIGVGSRLIQTFNLSGASSLVLTSAMMQKPGNYALVLDGVWPSSAGAVLRLRTSTDGVNFASGASDYSYAHSTVNTANTSPSGGAENSVALNLHNSAPAAGDASLGVHGRVDMFGIGLPRQFHCKSSICFQQSGGLFATEEGGGRRKSATAVTAIHLSASSGNINGTVKLYEVM